MLIFKIEKVHDLSKDTKGRSHNIFMESRKDVPMAMHSNSDRKKERIEQCGMELMNGTSRHAAYLNISFNITIMKKHVEVILRAAITFFVLTVQLGD
jgi:hypothetical protein